MAFQDSYIPGDVAIYPKAEMTQKKFYMKHLAMNKPVVIDDGCRDWKALDKWQDADYVNRMIKYTQYLNYATDEELLDDPESR